MSAILIAGHPETLFAEIMKAVIENGIVSSPYKPWKVPHTSLYTYYKAHLEKFGERTALVSEKSS